MPRTCSICGKGSQMSTRLVKLRGKFNPTCKIRKYPNLQWIRLTSGVKPRVERRGRNAALRRGGHAPLRGKRVKACAQCIKTINKK